MNIQKTWAQADGFLEVMYLCWTETKMDAFIYVAWKCVKK